MNPDEDFNDFVFASDLFKKVKAVEIPRETWAVLLEKNGFSKSGAENMILMTDAVILGKTQAQHEITHTGIGFQEYIERNF